VEYTFRHYLAEEIGLNEEHFTAVVESYDVGVLCTVAKEVFTKARAAENAACVKQRYSAFPFTWAFRPNMPMRMDRVPKSPRNRHAGQIWRDDRFAGWKPGFGQPCVE